MNEKVEKIADEQFDIQLEKFPFYFKIWCADSLIAL
jgi:hypothetical protein